MTASATANTPVRSTANKPLRVHSALHFPLRKAISRRLWKVCGAGLTGLLMGAAILGAGYVDAAQLQDLGPGFHSLFNLDAARAVRYFGSIQILLAGQLALLIWWARSRAQSGATIRYRAWAWMAACCFLVSFAIGIDAHRAIAETMAWLASEETTSQADLGWLIPAGVCVLGSLWMVHADLRQCRMGLAMLWLAALAWISAAMMNRVFDLPLDPLSASMAQAGTVMFGHWCLLMSLLLHTRHVVHGHVEQRHSEVVANRAKKAPRKTSETVDKPATVKSSAQTRIDKAHKTTATSVEGDKKANAATSAVSKAPNSILATRTSLREERAKNAVVDKTLLKGLSKRERRQVRKQFREELREMHGELED